MEKENQNNDKAFFEEYLKTKHMEILPESLPESTVKKLGD